MSLEQITGEQRFRDKLLRETKAYLIDTSAKVGTYAIPMAVMEASQGLTLSQICKSRASVALADAVLGRMYGLSLNQTRKWLNPELKSGARAYLVDTSTMLAIYVPGYAAILTAVGASDKQIGSAGLWLSGILITTARPFAKYALDPWRKYWGTK